MTLRLATAIEHRRRIRRSVQFLQAQLRAHPDRWPLLTDLADAACLSPYHFIRLYQHATGETPQATVRRLKLRAAREQLAADPRLGVLDAALEHGYDSAQAFARAFRRQFGHAPSARINAAADTSAVAWPVHLPAMGFQAMALGRKPDVGGTFDEMMGLLDVAGVPRWGQDMLCVVAPDLRLAQACAIENPWVRSSLGLARQHHTGGWHLCISGQPDAVWRRWREPAIAAARDEDAPLLMRYVNDPAYRARQEQRIELYVPLARPAPLLPA
jgi:AraC-like DNA-binding protein